MYNHMKQNLRTLVEFMIIILAFQFLVGIYVNLYVNISPMVFPSGMMMMFSMGMPALMLHMLIGIILGVLSIGILFFATLSDNKKVVVYLSAIALVFVVLAGLNGLEFVFNGQNNINSFFMATSFIIVMLSEFSILLNLD